MEVKVKKAKIGFISAFSFMIALCLLIMLVPLKAKTVKANAEETSVAYFASEDRYTGGFWYNGNNGLKENKQNRNYGKDGMLLVFHWLRQNGQQSLDVDFLNDFTNDSDNYFNGEKANYVEYPSYVDSITGNIGAIDGAPFAYWMNTPHNITKTLKESYNGIQPLPIEGVTHNGEEFTWSHGGVEIKPNDAGISGDFTVELNDNEWHTVSYYIGSPWRHKYLGYDEQPVRLYDLDGKLIASHTVLDPNQGVYVKFIVKGSFKITFSPNSLSAYVNGLFFDPYEPNGDIGVSNVNAELQGSKTINLTWQNASNGSLTTVFRRVKGEKFWDFIAEVGEGVSAYTDETARVATTYEYVLASGTQTNFAPHLTYTAVKADFNQPQIRVKTYNLPDFAGIVEIHTADYLPTKLQFASSSFVAAVNSDLTVKATLYKEDSGVFVPYPSIEVTFTLEGENVYSALGSAVYTYENMNPVFAVGVTDSNGEVTVTSSVPYAGDYNVVASIQPQPDPLNDLYGYDSCSASAQLSATPSESLNVKVPVLTAVTDCVKPGNTVTITGFNITNDEQFKIAYRKNRGVAPGEFVQSDSIYYVQPSDIFFTDSLNATGVMFTLPKSHKAGMYDFWIRNKEGWSKGITMNAPRPLFLDTEAAYEGQEVQISGRNFMQNEYGVGDVDSSLSSIKVKLTQTHDSSGEPVFISSSYVLTALNGGVLTGDKVSEQNAFGFDEDIEASKKEMLKAEAIPYTYSMRITIKIPTVYELGRYTVSVSVGGSQYIEPVDNCKLEIVQKKAQNWNTEIFGEYSDSHIGNDPLDLGYYWAQDLNYTRVTTVDPSDADNNFANAAAFTSAVNTKIAALSNQGGGVLYFPQGTYYLYNDVTMKKDVIIVGAGEDKTTFIYCNKTDKGRVWFKTDKESNIGIARVKLVSNVEQLKVGKQWYAPKYLVKWDGDGRYDEDTTLTTVKNRFLVRISGDLYGDQSMAQDGYQRIISITGKNCVIKDSSYYGSTVVTELNSYGALYNVKFDFAGSVEMSPHWMGRYLFMENCYFDMHGMGHGPSIKSDQYIAYTYSVHAGNRVEPTNDGEAILMEAPTGAFSVGRVLASTPRTVTLDFTGGQKTLKGMTIRYNMVAVYISNGTGQGQCRYIKVDGINRYKNQYEFMDWEKDWDIMPDHTSVFGCIAPLSNITVYRLKAYDCVSTVCIYSNHIDTVVDSCILVDTGGITGGGLASGGMKGNRINPCINVRITNNVLTGVAPHYNNGIVAASVAQAGGIQLYSGGSGEYMGLLTQGITVRGNYLFDMIPAVANNGMKAIGSGIVLYFKGGQDNNANGMRYITVEDNVVENSQWGLYVERTMTGVVCRNNDISRTVDLKSDVTIDTPNGFYSEAYHEFYVNGVKSDLSGVYGFERLLPEAPASGGKIFYAWTYDQTFTENSAVVTRGCGTGVTLYAVYGYRVKLDYNYKRSNGADRGEFGVLKTTEGGTIAKALSEYGDPFRVEYDFGGWYTDKACTQAFDVSSPLNSNVTLYAKWTPWNASGEQNGNGSESNNAEDEQPKSKGCGCKSYAVGGYSVLGILLVFAAALLIATKKRPENR